MIPYLARTELQFENSKSQIPLACFLNILPDYVLNEEVSKNE